MRAWVLKYRNHDLFLSTFPLPDRYNKYIKIKYKNVNIKNKYDDKNIVFIHSN